MNTQPGHCSAVPPEEAAEEARSYRTWLLMEGARSSGAVAWRLDCRVSEGELLRNRGLGHDQAAQQLVEGVFT
jgi:hypothetical protein